MKEAGSIRIAHNTTGGSVCQDFFAQGKGILGGCSEIGVAAALEAKRLAEKYGKDYLDCEDLVQIMGIGRNNVRQLMCSDSFPTIEVGNRKVVSVIAFTLWSIPLSVIHG